MMEWQGGELSDVEDAVDDGEDGTDGMTGSIGCKFARAIGLDDSGSVIMEGVLGGEGMLETGMGATIARGWSLWTVQNAMRLVSRSCYTSDARR
jgi:hypothetical protein